MEKSQFRVLYREFLFRLVDLEVLSAYALGDANKLLGQFAATLLFLSILLSIAAFGFLDSHLPPPARLAAMLISEHFLISTTMLVVGLFAVLSWNSTFPERRDVLVLAPLPVRARTILLAKVAAVATALTLSVALLHGASGLIWPFAFAIQATPLTVPALTFDPTPAPVSLDAMQSVLNRALAHQLASGSLAPGTGTGLVVGIWKQGTARVFAYGAARPDSLFEIGSLTKTFTGLLLAQSVAQGQVTLAEPIRLLLPPGMFQKPRGPEITLLDLATHRSGLPRTAPGDWQEYLIHRGLGREPHPPFLYSNFGFGVLGQLLANRAGLTYQELLAQQIAQPLGLSDTVVTLSPEQQSRMLPGFDAEHRPVPWDAPGLPGAGAIRSTAADLLKVLAANLHPETLAGTLPQALALSHQPHGAGPAGTTIALAWLYNAAEDTWVHGGAMPGFTTHVYFHPRGGDAAVVLLNNGPGTLELPALIGAHIRQRLAGHPAVSLDTTRVPASSGLAAFPRWFAAYWFTMLAAGAFIYCGVLGVQGLAAQLLPRGLFLRVSAFLQMAAFCLFLCGYFLQPAFGGLESLSGPDLRRLLLWIPSYWFLALFHQLNGSMHPALGPLARQAWLGLTIVFGGTAIAYALSYARTLRKIVEQPDIAPGSRTFGWLPPFGTRLQTAIGQFTIRTLLRSRQHRVILAFYLGIGFALTIFLLKAPATQAPLPDAAVNPWREANTPLLAASIVMLALATFGTRVVFALPMDLRANWIFRMVGVTGGPQTRAAIRRSVMLLSILPLGLCSAALCFVLWPWQQAAGHVALLLLLGILLADGCLHQFRKIPFTCSYLPGKSQVNILFLGAVALLWAGLLAVRFERQVLQEPRATAIMLLIVGLLAVCVRLVTVISARREEADLCFEEEEAPTVQQLGLHRDGVLFAGPAESTLRNPPPHDVHRTGARPLRGPGPGNVR